MVTFVREKTAVTCFDRNWNCLHHGNITTKQWGNTKPKRENDYLNIGHQKRVLCTETEHFPYGTSEICSVHRNRILSRRYIRNVYSAQKQNTFHTVHQKCVLCTETEHFPHGTSEMCIVHRNRTHSTHKAVPTDHKASLNK